MRFIIKTDKANKQPDRPDGRTSSRPSFKIVSTKFMNSDAVVVAATSGNLFNLRFDIYLHFEGETFFSLAFSLVMFGFLLLCRAAAAANRRQINATACCNLGEKIFCCCCCFCCFFVLVLQRQQSIDQAIKRSNERAKAAPAMSKSFEPIDGQ